MFTFCPRHTLVTDLYLQVFAASVTNDAALKRSVDMASRMAGWAGRVVERVLKEHSRQVSRDLRSRFFVEQLSFMFIHVSRSSRVKAGTVCIV